VREFRLHHQHEGGSSTRPRSAGRRAGRHGKGRRAERDCEPAPRTAGAARALGRTRHGGGPSASRTAGIRGAASGTSAQWRRFEFPPTPSAAPDAPRTTRGSARCWAATSTGVSRCTRRSRGWAGKRAGQGREPGVAALWLDPLGLAARDCGGLGRRAGERGAPARPLGTRAGARQRQGRRRRCGRRHRAGHGDHRYAVRAQRTRRAVPLEDETPRRPRCTSRPLGSSAGSTYSVRRACSSRPGCSLWWLGPVCRGSRVVA
jgi:hypothetical protein